jgi:cysteine-rich repeat protein
MTTWRPLALPFLVAAALSGCGDNLDLELPEDTTTEEASVMVRGDAASVTAECDQAPDGTPCGDGGWVMHCLYNACVLNVCGDGVKAGDEVCDDGDQEDADACNSRCQEPMCGNGLVDGRDQCDDGNKDDSDGCDSTCRSNDAGSGSKADGGATGGNGADASLGTDGALAMDAGASAMDGGGAVDTGTGALDTGSEAVDTGTIATSDTGAPVVDSGTVDAAGCQECVRAAASPCRDWFGGGDMVAGCFNNADPAIVERCVALYRCALRASDLCVNDPTGVVKCYCGETPIDGACFTGNAATPPTGKCIPEIYAASGCTTPQCVSDNLVNEGTASYYAQYLSLCTVNSAGCQSACPVPQPTPF